MRSPACIDHYHGPCPARVRGKFIYLGDRKLYVRGVTYGTFRPTVDGSEYPSLDVVARDFAQMAAHGVNAVRTVGCVRTSASRRGGRAARPVGAPGVCRGLGCSPWRTPGECSHRDRWLSRG